MTHQPNSLDDLDETDTIPFDTVPVRYDTTGKYFGNQFHITFLDLLFFVMFHLIYVSLNSFLFDLGMFDLATNWSEPSSTTNPEMNQM